MNVRQTIESVCTCGESLDAWPGHTECPDCARITALNTVVQEAPMGPGHGRDLTGDALSAARILVFRALSLAKGPALRGVCDLNGWDTEGDLRTVRARIMRERFGEYAAS